jgi:hypothetical protein
VSLEEIAKHVPSPKNALLCGWGDAKIRMAPVFIRFSEAFGDFEKFKTFAT